MSAEIDTALDAVQDALDELGNALTTAAVALDDGRFIAAWSALKEIKELSENAAEAAFEVEVLTEQQRKAVSR